MPNSAAGTSSKSSRATTTKVGTGGWSTSTTSTEQSGDTAYSATTTTGVTRGDGKLGATRTSSSSAGIVDDQGKLVRGTESSKTATGGVIAGPDGYGQYAGVSGAHAYTPRKGVKLGTSGGLDGRYTVNVTAVPGTDPPKYQIVVTLTLGAKVGGSASGEKEWKADEGQRVSTGTKAGGTASGAASGAVTATFTHVMAEDDAAAYLATLQSPAGGGAGATGAPREIAILRAALADGDSAAIAMLRGTKAALAGDPAAAAALSEGDSVDVNVSGKLEAKASASGQGGGGGPSLGLEGGASIAREFDLKITKVGGKVVVTATPKTTTSWSAGGSVGLGAGSFGYTHGETDTSSRSIAFTLDPAAPDFRQRYAQITGATSIAQLTAVASQHHDLVNSDTTTVGSSSDDTVKAGVGPVSVSFGQGAGRTTSATVDADNKVSTTYGASNTGGMDVSVAGLPNVGYHETDKLTATVSSDNKATADVGTTTSETTVGSSLEQLGTSLKEKPVGTVLGLVTGGQKPTAAKTDVAGMQLSDADFETLAATAQRPGDWNRPVASPRLLEDWQVARRRIAEAKGDRNQIAQALRDFVGTEGGDRAKAIEALVRPPGSAEGGRLYEWPGEAAAEQASFAALVDADPLVGARALEKQGHHSAALDAVNSARTRLDALVSGLESKRDKFSNGAAFGEMLSRAATRQGEVAREAALISARMRTGTTPPPPPPAGVTWVPTAEQDAQAKVNAEADKAQAKTTLDGYVKAMNGWLATQARDFGIVQTELAKKDAWFDKPDPIVMMKALNDLRDNVYPDWDATLTKARAEATKAGLDPWAIQPMPAHGWWNKLHKDSVAL